MSLVTWTDTLSVGLATIDAQHEKLVTVLNDLYGKVVALRGQGEVAAALAAMLEYAHEHFSFEESLMRRCAYPEEKMHQAEHHRFTDYALQQEQKLRAGEFVSSAEIVNYLMDWLTHHILEVDRRYTACLRAAEVDPPATASP